MKKKKIKFKDIKIGEYFKYYGKVYRKNDYHDAVQLVGKTYGRLFFCGNNNVIPVTVTIKVKEI